MRIRLLLAAAAAAALAACSDSSTSPRPMAPADKPAADISCRSGYHIATRVDGTEGCEPDQAAAYATPTTE
jgi:hypothetical protein